MNRRQAGPPGSSAPPNPPMKPDTGSQARPTANATPPTAAVSSKTSSSTEVQDRAIGEILRRTKGLTTDQIGAALAYARRERVRFGEAAVALGIIRAEDVMTALSQQFHYPYTSKPHNPLNQELYVANEPFGDDAETFRGLRSQLIMGLMSPNAERRVALAVVSPDVGDGKSFIASNLAVAFSHLPGRTLIVDADLRSPRIHQIFGLDNTSGLSNILSGRTESNVIRQVNDLPNLFLLSSGTVPPNPLELVQQPAFDLLIQELLEKFDHVIVDTAAAEYGSDARIVSAKCGAALIVARKHNTRSVGLQSLVRMIEASTTMLAGVVMNEF